MIRSANSAARAFVHEAALQAYEAAAAGKLELDGRIRLRLATTYAMNEATDVSIGCYRAAGTTASTGAPGFERQLPLRISAGMMRCTCTGVTPPSTPSFSAAV